MKNTLIITLFIIAVPLIVLYSCRNTGISNGSSEFQYEPVKYTILEDESPGQEEDGEWNYPIAPGVYYPWKGDGDLDESENDMRYYRVRCWPGCHTGSSIGMYPDDAFEDTPIFMTSKIDYPAGH